MENKKAYIKPILESETFVPQEYVAACNEEATSYLFTCDAYSQWHSGGWGRGHYSPLYYYKNGSPNKLGGYHPCQATHLAPVKDEFYPGFVDNNENGREDPGEECYVWLEKGHWWGESYIKDWHATKNINPNSWAKNHS